MYSLIGECRFWTTSSDVKIKSTDFGSFRFHDKKETPTDPSTASHFSAKSDYSELRGHKLVLDNKRPHRLKDAIRKLEDHLHQHPVVHSQWRDNSTLRLMLSNGLLVHICINVLTGSVVRITYDKYFLGKITQDTITDVLITKQHIIIAYNQNQITFVYLQKPPATIIHTNKHQKPATSCKISRMDPKIYHIIIGGPSSTQGRRLSRHIACNASNDMIAVWTRSSQNEVYPWRPTVRDQDRANIHIYSLNRSKLEPVCFHWTENDPLVVEFVRGEQKQNQQLKIVEQRVTRKGEVFVEDQVYEIVVARGVRGLQRTGVTSIPLQSQVCAQSYSADQEKLMLGCIDGSVCLFDAQRGVTHMVRAGFIPTHLSWHCDSAVVLVGNERGQLQFFDMSLNCIKSQLASEDITPSNLIDLSAYFAQQPILQQAMFNKKPELHLNAEKYAQTDCFVFLAFEGGVVACVRIIGGCGLRGDIHTSGFTVDVLVHNYLAGNQVERAINLLLCLNWDVYGAMCLISLHKIVNYILRRPLTKEREVQLEKALGSFHAPVKPLLEDTEVEFGEQVKDIMRKFFQHLVRYRAFDKAFALGIDINDDDLFVDLYNAARLEGNEEMAKHALRKAEGIIRHQDENQSICSHSSCSYCGSVVSGSGSEDEEEEDVEKTGNRKTRQQEHDPTSRPDIIAECSKRQPQDMLPHPPLPTTSYREPCYIPPLPFPNNNKLNHSNPSIANSVRTPKKQLMPGAGTSSSSNTHHQRMFIPKPQLTVSHHKSSSSSTSSAAMVKQRNSALLSNELSVNYDRSLNEIDLDDFVYDYVPKTASKRVLVGGNRDEVDQQKLLRRDMVIDIFPNPGHAVNGLKKKNNDIDQTLGIPVAASSSGMVSGGPYDVPGVMKTNLPRQPTMNLMNPLGMPLKMTPKYERTVPGPHQVVHQYPLISGHIPAMNGTESPMFNMIMAQPRPFQDGPPVVQPSAMGGGTGGGGGSSGNGTGGAGTSSNSSKSSGEKHKVKFSETIQVAVLPEIPRKEKPMDHHHRMKGGGHRGMPPGGGSGGGGVALGPNGMPPSSMKRRVYTDPKRELADSLPLCHPNEDYLKDFQPASSENVDNQERQDTGRGQQEDDEDRRRTPGTIKVIHFGVV